MTNLHLVKTIILMLIHTKMMPVPGDNEDETVVMLGSVEKSKYEW